MALTILQFWQQQQANYQAAQASAQKDLAAAQLAQKDADKQLADGLKALDQATADIAEKRARLAVTTIPADAMALVAEIKAKIIQQRALQGQVLDGRDGLDAAQTCLDATNARLARIQARLADIQAKLAQAKTGDAQRQALRQAVASAPLKTLMADAAAFAGGGSALSGLKKNFPQPLLDIASQRYQQRSRRLAKLQDAVDSAQAALGAEFGTDGGLQGVASQKLAEFQRAQDQLAQYVATAANRYHKALAVMQALADIDAASTPQQPGILSQAEHDQVVLPANAMPGAAAIGEADALAQAATDAIKQAADDLATAAQLADALQVAEQTAADKVLAAGLAAAKAAATGDAADEAAATDAAKEADKAQQDAAQAAQDKAKADVDAKNSAAAAKQAIADAAAAPKAKTLGICLDAVWQAQDGLDAQTLAQIHADVDQLDTAPAILGQRAAVKDAIDTYQKAVAAFAAAASPNQSDLDNWQAIIPDTAWKVLLDYEESFAALDELGTGLDPVKLAQAMDDAEQAYTAALSAAEKAQRRIDSFGEAIGQRSQRLALAQAAITARLPSAIRGDTY